MICSAESLVICRRPNRIASFERNQSVSGSNNEARPLPNRIADKVTV
jgi:hypothetical protein